MSRVVLHFDDGTKIDFNNEDDALHHLSVNGSAGVSGLNEEADEDPGVNQGKRVKTRAQLDKAVKDKADAEGEAS